jgi:hypothetical protein
MPAEVRGYRLVDDRLAGPTVIEITKGGWK